jgi:septal ring factor EnvC (AmiA/AmiB activator)
VKKIIIYWCDFIVLINKLLSQIFKEFSICKKENTKLKKRSYRDELKLNNKINELDDIKKYVNRFDINMKINQQIQKEKEIKQLKTEFKKKENEYKLSIYKLEDEIKMLTLLLEKNKNYYEEYKNISKEVGKNKRQCELLKIKFNKELQDNNVKYLIEKDFQEELKLKMQELREEIKAIKLEKEMSKKENIELQAKIKKLEMVINEREENILMIYQELDYYMRKFNEEKFNHNNFKNEFNILEKKIYRLEEERQKEKNKINANDIKDIDSLSPKHYIKEDNYGSPSPTNFTINNNS